LTSIEKIEQAYMSIGRHLGLQDVTPADMKMRFKAHLSSETAGPWLLINDSADDMVIWVTPDSSSPAFITFRKVNIALFSSRPEIDNLLQN
jgi:hypothetical protein